MAGETGHYVCWRCGHSGAVTPPIQTPCFRCGTLVDPRASPQVEGSEEGDDELLSLAIGPLEQMRDRGEYWTGEDDGDKITPDDVIAAIGRALARSSGGSEERDGCFALRTVVNLIEMGHHAEAARAGRAALRSHTEGRTEL